MTYNNFYGLVLNAAKYLTAEDFAAHESLPPFMPNDTDKAFEIYRLTFAASRKDFNEIVKSHKLAEISRKFAIPYDTIHKWSSGNATPAPYLVNLIAYALCNDL